MESNSATEEFHTPMSKSFQASSLNDFNSKGLKTKIDVNRKRNSNMMLGSSCHDDLQRKRQKIYMKPLDRPDPFSIDVLQGLDYSSLSRYGSVAKEIEDLITRKISKPHSAMNTALACICLNMKESSSNEVLNTKGPTSTEVIILDDDNDVNSASGDQLLLSAEQVQVPLSGPLVILDSDDEGSTFMKSADDHPLEICKEHGCADKQSLDDKDEKVAGEVELEKDKCLYVREENDTRTEEGYEKCPYVGMESDNDEKIAGEVELTKYECEKSHCFGIVIKEEKIGPYVEVEDNKDEKVAGQPELTEDKGKESPCVGIEDIKDGMVAVEANKGVYVGIEDETGTQGRCEKGPYVGIEGDIGEKVAGAPELTEDKGVYVGVEEDTETEEGDDQTDDNYDGLADIWKQMKFAMECSKDISVDLPSKKHPIEGGEECDHLLILKDDIGDVCRICGFVQRTIESIIEYQYMKGTRSTRTYLSEVRSCNTEPGDMLSDRIRSAPQEVSDIEIYAHPRHQKQMKLHQVEGFNFLIRNLVTNIPGGCILAHAPGSGKTFMIISFLQSFMAKYPLARPLVVLPKGILETWKREFQKWQVESIPLYDFYSVQAGSRPLQLEVLRKWESERSILFLGYQQFSTIVCDGDGRKNESGKISTACKEILLTCPSILIMDEGHTPRNQNTDILTSLGQVQTPRKVVLSGTLYQNRVREVFNILNLVRPKFLKLDRSRDIKRRILSRIRLTSRRNLLTECSEHDFYELVGQTLEKDENFKRKVAVIQDLREMTDRVLHYYKGDSLDELPGLEDFTVLLKMSPRQEKEVAELKTLNSRFTINSKGSAIYVHPQLTDLPKGSGVQIDDMMIDRILKTLDVKDGVKAKFYLNLLQLCESSDEKLLVFSQYLLPLKFLERLTMKVKGYTVGKEIFMITGDSDSEMRESSMERFNTSSGARVFFGSIKACGEGISLVGASRILILDVHLNPSVTRQAIGRAYRPGQLRKVYTYRLVAHDSPEEEDHKTCFRKESIAKLWFEWNESYGNRDFEMELVDLNDCKDLFLESSLLNEDVYSVYRR